MNETDQIAAEAAKRAFIRYEKYVQKRDVWHMPPQLPLSEDLLAEIIQSAIEKAYEQGYMNGTENLAGALSRAAQASEDERGIDSKTTRKIQASWQKKAHASEADG